MFVICFYLEAGDLSKVIYFWVHLSISLLTCVGPNVVFCLTHPLIVIGINMMEIWSSLDLLESFNLALEYSGYLSFSLVLEYSGYVRKL